ncbi:MAG: ABC transporter substrate-binding protein [Bacillota bacterium]
MKAKILIGAVIVLLMSLLLVGCGGKSTDTPPTVDQKDTQEKYGGIFRIVGPGGDPQNIDPQLNRSYLTQWAVGPVYNRLVKPKMGPGISEGSFIPEPDLAQEWDISEDGLVYTFYLRKGVKWHDVPPVNGREFVASDVRFNFDRIFELKGPQYDLFSNVDKIETPDDYTVKFTLKKPQPAFLQYLGSGYSWMVAPETVREFGDVSNVAIGTGPFILEEYERGVALRYRANPDYFLGRPYFDGVEMLIMADDAARLAAFRAGELDMINYVSVDVAELIFKSNPKIENKLYNLNFPRMLWIQTEKKPFNDVKVRQAINFAIDKQAIHDVILKGGGTYSSPVGGASEWSLSKEDREHYLRYDPELAKKLLKEAGYENGFKTVIKLATYGTQALVDMASMIKENLAAVGIKADIEIVEYAVGLETRQSGTFELYLGPQQSLGEADQWLRYQYSTSAFLNHGRFSDSYLDELLEKQSSEMDETKRKELVLEAQHYIMEKMPIVLLYDQLFYWPVQPWVKGFAINYEYGTIPWESMWLDKE